MKNTLYSRLSVLAFAAVVLAGCSELKTGGQTTNPLFVYVLPDGFRSPSSPNFHGVAIQQAGWEIRNCRQCHGGTYAGANAISCVSAGCHVDASGNAKSPESCNTCHGTFSGDPADTTTWVPPRSLSGDTSSTSRGVGAHEEHMIAAAMDLSTPVGCATCHTVPSGVYASGHINGSSPAQVTFGGQIVVTPSGGLTPQPSYDAQSLRCSNTYCHGNFRARKATSQSPFIYTDTVIAGSNYSPQWTGGDTQDACGTCHGMPPAGHLNFGSSIAACTSCHYLNGTPGATQLDQSIHINGKIDVYGKEYSFK